MLYVTPDSYKILTHCQNNFEPSISIVKKNNNSQRKEECCYCNKNRERLSFYYL